MPNWAFQIRSNSLKKMIYINQKIPEMRWGELYSVHFPLNPVGVQRPMQCLCVSPAKIATCCKRDMDTGCFWPHKLKRKTSRMGPISNPEGKMSKQHANYWTLALPWLGSGLYARAFSPVKVYGLINDKPVCELLPLFAKISAWMFNHFK